MSEPEDLRGPYQDVLNEKAKLRALIEEIWALTHGPDDTATSRIQHLIGDRYGCTVCGARIRSYGDGQLRCETHRR